MQFLILLLPMAAWVNAAGIHSYIVDRSLIRLVRTRDPEVLELVRGRPRRWYDPPDELTFQQAQFWRAMHAALSTPRVHDSELSRLVEKSERAHRALRDAVLGGSLISAALLVAVRVIAA